MHLAFGLSGQKSIAKLINAVNLDPSRWVIDDAEHDGGDGWPTGQLKEGPRLHRRRLGVITGERMSRLGWNLMNTGSLLF